MSEERVDYLDSVFRIVVTIKFDKDLVIEIGLAAFRHVG
jgi:hypothetical protein